MLPDALTAQQLKAVAYPDLKWTLNELPAGNLAHYKLHDPEAPELAELVLSPFGRVTRQCLRTTCVCHVTRTW